MENHCEDKRFSEMFKSFNCFAVIKLLDKNVLKYISLGKKYELAFGI